MIKNLFLKNIWGAFGDFKHPTRIATKCKRPDKEREQIELHFQEMDRDAMSYYDVSMMLIDGALIEPKAYLYYLPRLTEGVLLEDNDAHFLNAKMDDLLNIDSLTSEQKSALDGLKSFLVKHILSCRFEG